MKVTKQTQLLILSDAPTIRSVPFGSWFSYKGKILMRVKPVQFLLNSTLVTDVINRGDCFVVDMETGNLYVTDGSKSALFANATLVVTEEA